MPEPGHLTRLLLPSMGGAMLAAAALFFAPVAHAQVGPSDAELVTVTERGFTATWTTAEASDTTVCFGPSGGALRCDAQEPPTRFHRVQVDGLDAGRRYDYTLRSRGAAQPPSTTNPGSFTTLVPPPGEHLFDFALLSDVHIGEGCSGTAITLPPPGGSVPPCFRTSPPDPPYAAAMGRAAVDELNAGRIGLVILNGDNTGQAGYESAAELKDILGGLDAQRYIARGNHDRASQNAPDPRCGDDNDCFRSVLFPDRPRGRIFYSFDSNGYHFIALDSNDAAGIGDLTDAAQRAFLERDLEQARAAGKRTFVFFHHPVSEYANTTSFPPVVFGVRPDKGGADFLTLLARFPNVVGVLNAHTHRNYVSYSPQTGVGVPFIENGPTKEYPGGYSIFRVYTGGYTRNFQRLSCEFCRRWISTTRAQYFGLYPNYTAGTLSARNFTHVYDCAVPTPPPSPPTGSQSAGESDTVRPACPAGSPPPGGQPSEGQPGGGPAGAEPDRPAAGDRASGRGCHLPRVATVGPRGIGRIRLGQSSRRITSSAGPANRRGRRSLRYCVRGGGRVLAALSERRTALLVATLAPGHSARGVRRGSSLAALRRAYPAARPVGGRYWRTGPSGRIVFGVKRGRVRFVATVGRPLLRNQRLLRSYVRRVGL